MSAQHTPGPWTIRDDHPNRSAIEIDPYVCSLYIAQGDDNVITVNDVRRNDIVRMANARLIAASPELLEALAYIVDQVEKKENETCTLKQYKNGYGIDMAKKAIAKAKGKA